MSITTNRETAPRDGGSVDHRLARLLDTPFFARVVPYLPPETLHQLIQYRGLDACGELVTSATPAQLTSLLDLDLWRHAQPGRDDQFDVDRFGEWLEVLVDAGDSVAARTVAALDTHLVIVGLSRYLRPFDPGTFEPTESSDDEPMDRNEMMNSETSGDVLECEVGGYLVRARRTDAWDAIVTLLVTLDTEHNHYFHAVMQGCRRLSNSRPEVDGLDDLLMAPEQHLHDVAIERERRRSRHGFATPADARAFLQLARQPMAPTAINPIATAYFRAANEQADTTPEDTSAGAPESAPRHDATDASARGDDIPTSIDAVIELLAEAGVMPERPRALLKAADEDPRATTLPLLKRLMEFVPAPRRARVPHAQSRTGLPREYAARGILGSVAAVHAPGGVRCGGVHLQPGSRMLAHALAGRDLAGCIVATRTRHGHASQRVPRGSRPGDGVRSGLVGAVPGRQPVRGG